MMLSEVKRLHALGLALHWLQPKSKAPIKSKWTKIARAPLPELLREYRPGMNLGVRLGDATRFPDGTYLAVVDLDVKAKSARAQALARLRELSYESPIRVDSGRGNKSSHHYFRTKEPQAPVLVYRSPVLCKTHMPSAKATDKNTAGLTPEEIKSGMRIRPEWEIGIMGNGQQVVLPPSVHPDSGRLYSWGGELKDWKDIPLISFGTVMPIRKKEIALSSGPVVFEEVELVDEDLPESTAEMILNADTDDRSTAMMLVCEDLIRENWSDNKILSVLTDRNYALAEAALERRGNRQLAAQWVRQYCLEPAKARDPLLLFPDPEEGESEEVGEPRTDGWLGKLKRGGRDGRCPIKNTLENAIAILKSVSPTLFKRNEFFNVDIYGEDAPWGRKAGQIIEDDDLILIKVWVNTKYKVELSTDRIVEAFKSIALGNAFHPVREYLAKLTWDGQARLEGWLSTYMGATGEKRYLEAVGRKTLVAMVARVMKPGCKFDHVLVLEGPQGCGKSTAVRLLGGEWFSDTYITIGDKDAVLALQRAWVLELGELSSLRKADIDQLKQFISQTEDRIRAPYGRLMQTFPRQSVFIGTTNNSEYLKDATGNRRFWPVEVKGCRFKELARDRDQLLAEALFYFEMGETLYLDNRAIENLAMNEQAKRVFNDEWEGLLETFFEAPNEGFPVDKFTIADLFEDTGPLAKWKMNKGEQMRAGHALRAIGFERRRGREPGRIGRNHLKYYWELKVPTVPTLSLPSPVDGTINF